MDIVEQLADFGFKVLEAENAAEAVKMLTDNSDIQIMFTDIDMPGKMDGLRLAAAVRDAWSPIKIIVTSGHRKVCIDDMPANSRFYPKPYVAKDIANAMEQMLSLPVH